jgi:hypothetical protein
VGGRILSADEINVEKQMKASLLILLLLPLSAAAEKCPEVNGKAPQLAAEAGGYKFFYFPDNFSADAQQGALYVAKAAERHSFEVVLGSRDWFRSLSVDGAESGLSVDSQNFEFESAWVLEGGVRQNLREGRAYIPNCEH